MVIPPRHTLRTLGIALLLAILVHLGLFYGVIFSPPAGPVAPLAVRLQPSTPLATQPAKQPLASPRAPTAPNTRAKSVPPAHPTAPDNVVTAPQESRTTAAATTSSDLNAAPPASVPKAAPVTTPAIASPLSHGSETTIKQPPRLLKRIEPAYPPQARSQGIEGQVKVRLHIDTSGRPVTQQIISSSGSTLLDNALLAVVSQWQFSPAVATTGQATEADIIIPYRFRLQSTDDE
ncbi:energy transducer TonB [Leeia oryzae]|uniref:energy transducer TonB n=1 Tax=Leeia oryzae TaxID=356662 RepID=UPI0003805AAA|nr:energy transducer TonB [Leeia oryzae]